MTATFSIRQCCTAAIWSGSVLLAWLLDAPFLMLAAVTAIWVYGGRTMGLLSGAASALVFGILLYHPGPNVDADVYNTLRLIAFVACVFGVGLFILDHREFNARRRADFDAQLIVESMPGLGWSSEPDGRLRYITQSVWDYIGRQHQDDLNRTEGSQNFGWERVIHPDDVGRAVERWSHSLRTGEPYDVEHRILRFDGTYRWFRAAARPSRDQHGNITGWYGATIDIDDRKQTEDALRASRASLQSILDNIPGMIATTDPGGNHDYANKRNIDYFGVKAAELDGTGFLNVIHPDERDYVAKAWAHSVKTGEPVNVDNRLRRFDGEYHWCHARFEPAFDESGKIVRWYGLITDIHEQKAAEDKLRATERDLRTTIDTVPALVASSWPDGALDFVNAHWVEEGFQKADLHGVPTDIIHPDDLPRFREKWITSLGTGEPYQVETRLRKANGEYRWYLARAVTSRDETGKVIKRYASAIDIDDRKRAEEVLRSRERHLQQLIDAIPTLVWSATPEGKPSYISNRMLAYYGMDRDELTESESHFKMVHPDDGARVASDWAQSVATGSSFMSTLRLRRADGEYRWHEARAEGLRDETGKIVEWYGVNVDVDDRQRAEEGLRRREQELRRLTDAIPAFVWCATPDGVPFYINKRLMDYVGLTPEDFDRPGTISLAEAIKAILHPDDRAAVGRAFDRNYRAGKPFDLPHRIRRADGAYRWVECRAEPWHDDEGRLVQWYGVNVDIHDRQTAEDALRSNERQLRQLFDAIPTFVWTVSPDGMPTYHSKRTLDYLGIAPQDVRHFRERSVHPDDRPALQQTWARSLTTGEVFTSTLRLRRADGEYRWHEARAEPLRDENGVILQWYGANVDIDERMKAEQALRSAQAKFLRASQLASLAELSASIAHEVNQPLTAIVSHSYACQRWLDASPPNIQRAQVTIGRIIRDANAAAEVVSRVRALFKKSNQTGSTVDLNEVIVEVRQVLTDELVMKNISFETDLDKALPVVIADRVQMQQLLVNLFRNGIDAMASMSDLAKRLRVRSRRDGSNAVLVEVEDQGIGIDDPEKIFEPFFTTKDSGMGMGLAICRTIVEAHRGRLWAGRGSQGTVFRFTLALNPDEPT